MTPKFSGLRARHGVFSLLLVDDTFRVDIVFSACPEQGNSVPIGRDQEVQRALGGLPANSMEDKKASALLAHLPEALYQIILVDMVRELEWTIVRQEKDVETLASLPQTQP